MYPHLECIIYIIQHWKYKFHFQKKSSHKTSNRTLYNPNALRPETTPFFRKFSPKKPSLPPPKMVPWQYTRTCVQIMQTCRGVIVLLRLRSQTTRRQRPRPTRPPGCTAASQTVVRGRRAPLHLRGIQGGLRDRRPLRDCEPFSDFSPMAAMLWLWSVGVVDNGFFRMGNVNDV